MALAYENSVPAAYRSAFIEKVKTICSRLQIDPNWLMIVMRFETANQFTPYVENKGSGAVGLIQFTSSTATALGTNLVALKLMSALDQLDYVERYLTPYKGRMTDVYQTYMAVFAPAYIGKPDAQTVYASPQLSYTYNKALDTNNDGKITVNEIKAVISRYIPAGFESVDTIQQQAKSPLVAGIGIAAALLLSVNLFNQKS